MTIRIYPLYEWNQDRHLFYITEHAEKYSDADLLQLVEDARQIFGNVALDICTQIEPITLQTEPVTT